MAFIQLSRTNLYHNLNQLALKAGSKSQLAIVLKDNAYGHGIKEIASMAKEFGLDKCVVGNYQEALEVKEFFQDIIVLEGAITNDSHCSFVINSLEAIQTAQEGAKVELKIDTGMHRNGISIEMIDRAISLIEKRKLKLIGLLTHHRSADELSSEFFWQEQQFKQAKKRLQELGYERVRFHSANSAALARKNLKKDEICRIGISSYGYHTLHSAYSAFSLKPVLSLYAKRVSKRILDKGMRVGYGGEERLLKQSIVSTYDIGYGDGLHRLDADFFDCVGRISMDFITLAKDCETVMLFDNASKLAIWRKTIVYEILTSLNSSIERIVVD